MNDSSGPSAGLSNIYGGSGGSALSSNWAAGSSTIGNGPTMPPGGPSRALIGGNMDAMPSLLPEAPPPLPPRPLNPLSTLNPMQSSLTSMNSGGYLGGSSMLGSSPYSPYVAGSYGMGGMGGYGYGTMGSSMLGGYSSGLMGGGYGGYNQYGGMGGNPQMSQMAEEQSRQAFSSLESFIQTFSSISMMLESSLNAVYMSFRAALGLADQFSRLKAHFQHLFATLTLVRMLRWLWQRLMVLIRLRKASSLPEWNESVWQESSAAAGSVLASSGKAASGGSGANWAMMALTAIALGGPYLIWKLASSLVNQAQEKVAWASGRGSHYKGVALHPFNASNQSELSLRPGDQIIIAPKESQPELKGWLLASKVPGPDQAPQVGIVPSNYVKVFPSVSSSSNATPGGKSWADDYH